jgi:hypothetical protein
MLPTSEPRPNESIVPICGRAIVPSISTRRWPCRVHTFEIAIVNALVPSGLIS